MTIIPGKVRDGKIVVDSVLAEGTEVTVLVPDDEPFHLSPEDKEELLESMRAADRGETMDAFQHLKELDEED